MVNDRILDRMWSFCMWRSKKTVADARKPLDKNTFNQCLNVVWLGSVSFELRFDGWLYRFLKIASMRFDELIS